MLMPRSAFDLTSTVRAGVPTADVRGRAVSGPSRAEGEPDEGAREPLAAVQRVR